MALPAKAKTWLYDFHQIASTSNIDWHREALFRFVDKMLTLGSNPWIVRYSGDGTTVGVAGDGVNRWAAETDLNWSSGNHSWMVLENVDGVQVLFDLDFSSSQAYRMNALMSQSEGFHWRDNLGATNRYRRSSFTKYKLVREPIGSRWRYLDSPI